MPGEEAAGERRERVSVASVGRSLASLGTSPAHVRVTLLVEAAVHRDATDVGARGARAGEQREVRSDAADGAGPAGAVEHFSGRSSAERAVEAGAAPPPGAELGRGRAHGAPR